MVLAEDSAPLQQAHGVAFERETIAELSIPELHTLISLSSVILEQNVHTEGSDCGYTTPSGLLRVEDHEPVRLYPHQWLWDAFFIAAHSENLDQSQRDSKIFSSAA